MDWYELVQTYAHSRQLSTARLNKIIFLFQGVTRGGRADSKFREELLRCMSGHALWQTRRHLRSAHARAASCVSLRRYD